MSHRLLGLSNLTIQLGRPKRLSTWKIKPIYPLGRLVGQSIQTVQSVVELDHPLFSPFRARPSCRLVKYIPPTRWISIDNRELKLGHQTSQRLEKTISIGQPCWLTPWMDPIDQLNERFGEIPKWEVGVNKKDYKHIKSFVNFSYIISSQLPI